MLKKLFIVYLLFVFSPTYAEEVAELVPPQEEELSEQEIANREKAKDDFNLYYKNQRRLEKNRVRPRCCPEGEPFPLDDEEIEWENPYQ